MRILIRDSLVEKCEAPVLALLVVTSIMSMFIIQFSIDPASRQVPTQGMPERTPIGGKRVQWLWLEASYRHLLI